MGAGAGKQILPLHIFCHILKYNYTGFIIIETKENAKDNIWIPSSSEYEHWTGLDEQWTGATTA